MKLMDLLLLPESLFKRFSDRKITLYVGFVFVGIVDLIFNRLMIDFEKNFAGKTQEVLTHNIVYLVLFIIIIGVLDVAFFSIPLHDLFRFFKKKIIIENASGRLADRLINELEQKKQGKPPENISEDKPNNINKNTFETAAVHDSAPVAEKVSEPSLRIKLMKVYIASHFLVVPVNMVIDYMMKNVDEQSSSVVLSVIAFMVIMTMIWFNAIIARGASVVFQLGQGFKLILYIVIFTWNFMFGKALTYAIDTWVIPFFK
jgi:hypothetical protein